MARALVHFERQADASWLPTTVILATPRRLQGKALPGDPNREALLARILTDALPPRVNDFTEERGDYEDWITWGVYNLANGHTSWASEVKPEMTVDALYQREVRVPKRPPRSRAAVMAPSASSMTEVGGRQTRASRATGRTPS